MPRVKVGLNQWVVANNDEAELVTDGLSGCIGVVIWTDYQICLAHVYSDYGRDNMAAYNHQLSLPVAVMMQGDRQIRGCAVVYSDNVDKARALLVLAWCKSLGVDPDTFKASGVRVSYSSLYGCEIVEKEIDDRDLYQLHKGALTTSTGVAHITNWGELASNASEAT